MDSPGTDAHCREIQVKPLTRSQIRSRLHLIRTHRKYGKHERAAWLLNREITKNDPRCTPGRKHHPDYQWSLFADANAVRSIRRAGARVYSFRTAEFRDRLSHLLSEYPEHDQA